MTGYHVLKYPLNKAKEDLAKADGGFKLDVSVQTHEHTKYVEHHFSGADLGLIFIVQHPLFGRSERAVLLQAKRLFPKTAPKTFALDSGFNSFHADQFAMLNELQTRFKAWQSIFYLWYSPASCSFTEHDGKMIRALEAIQDSDWGSSIEEAHFFEMRGYRYMPEIIRKRRTMPISKEVIEVGQIWRTAQPGTRVSDLASIGEFTKPGPKTPTLMSLYKLREERRWHGHLAFEPLADFFIAWLLGERVGSSSKDWIRLARGEKVPMPAIDTTEASKRVVGGLPENVPAPRHTLTFVLRSALEEGS